MEERGSQNDAGSIFQTELERRKKLSRTRNEKEARANVVAEAKAKFEATGHPLYVFAIWNYLRKRGDNPPDWVLEHMDHLSSEILAMPDNLPINLQDGLAKALGFEDLKGARKKLRLWAETHEAVDMFKEFLLQIDSGNSQASAIDSLAEKFSLSESTIKTRLKWVAANISERPRITLSQFIQWRRDYLDHLERMHFG